MLKTYTILLSIILSSVLFAGDDVSRVEYIIRPNVVGLTAGFDASGTSLLELAKPSRKRVKEKYWYPVSIKQFFDFIDEFPEEEKLKGINILWFKGLVQNEKVVEISDDVRRLGVDKDYEVFLVVADLKEK